MMNVNEQLDKYIQPLKAYWEKQEAAQRKKIFAIVGVVVACALALVMYLNYQPYTTLFTGLESQEVSEILAKLQERGVEAKLEGNGTILVPENQEASLKMSLATEGYPKSGLSYDLFTNNIGMMATESDRKAFQVFQLQERIQESIKTINGVKDAIVTISLPEDNSFVLSDQRKEPSASVKVTLTGGMELSHSQVNGIKQLVAKSTPGLKTEQVVVIDGDGNELGSDSSSVSEQTKNKIQLEKEIDKTIQQKVGQILTPIFGENNVSVVATSKVNYDKKLTQSVTYTPVGENSTTGIISNEKHYLEGTDGKILQKGIPGAETNSDTTVYPGGAANTKDPYYINDYNIDYYVNETKEEVQKEGAIIERISVAVTINDGNISDAQKTELTRLVATAANVNPEDVTIYNGAFGGPATIPTMGNINDFVNNNWMWIALGILIIIVVLFLIVRLIRKRKDKREEQEELERIAAVGPVTVVEDRIEFDFEKVKEAKQQELRTQVKEFVSNNPEIAAQMVRVWLKGEED